VHVRLTKRLWPGKVIQGRAYGPFFLLAGVLGGRTIGSTSDSGSDYPGSSPGLPANLLSEILGRKVWCAAALPVRFCARIPARFCEILVSGYMWLWPRVENSAFFVFFELRRFLHFGQNRVEVGDRVAKNASFSRGGSTAGSTVGSTAGALYFETQR
jgi:hypothetical protein